MACVQKRNIGGGDLGKYNWSSCNLSTKQSFNVSRSRLGGVFYRLHRAEARGGLLGASWR